MDNNIRLLISRLDSLENRILSLEAVINSKERETRLNPSKTLTLAEIVYGKSFKSGQEKVAIIVGYYEKIQGKKDINKESIILGWKESKMDGKFDNNYIYRSRVLIRCIDNNFDLTQSGEKFF